MPVLLIRSLILLTILQITIDCGFAEAVSVEDTRSIEHTIEILEDVEGQLDLSAVMARPETSWQPNPHETLALGYSTSVWWVRLKISHFERVALHHVLELAVASLDLVDAYIFRDSRLLSEVHTGDQRPFNTRPVHSPVFAFPVETLPHEPTLIILRLAMLDGVFDRIPVNLWTREDFAQVHPWRTLMAGAYYGAITILIAYNFLLYISTCERSFLYYVAYLTLFLIWNLGYLGFAYQYLWPDHSFWNNQVNYFLVFLVHIAASLFVIHYLELKDRHDWLFRFIWWMTLLLGIPTLVQIADTLGHDVPRILSVGFFVFFSTVLTLAYLSAGAILWLRGFRPARFFTLAWSFLILSILFYQLAAIPGIAVSRHIITDYAMNTGSLLEFLLLALAMGDRFNRLREEKLAVERKARLKEHAYAADLEKKVHERTRALSEAMEKLTVALQIERGGREEQSVFLTTISHELRTPLAVIDAIAQNLIMGGDIHDAASQSRYQRIRLASQRMADLLENYLRSDYLDELVLSLKLTPTDIRALLEETMHACRILSDQHVFSIVTDNLPQTFPADAYSLRLVLRILGDNAVKHTPPGTHVFFSGETTANGLRIWVADNGPGVPLSDQEIIFQPYYRGRDSKASFGHGLGLSLARRMINLHGGSLRLDSEKDPGCCFVIDLPMP